MNAGIKYLIDTSAVVRLFQRKRIDEWDRAQKASLIGLCDITEIEILHSARSKAHRERDMDTLSAMFPWVPIPDGVFDRAREVQHALTQRGWHRSAGPVDLMVAACAELSGLVLLHQDRDFETIAKVTGQPVRWLLPAEVAVPAER